MSDRKVIQSNGIYLADLVSSTDYYAFGMVMADRSFNTEGYRYGFNGKENDNEVKGTGNQQDYGMRIYDARLGRFLSVDPLTSDYPELTPYQFASNTPIQSVDLDGGESLDYRHLLDNVLFNPTTKIKIVYVDYVVRESRGENTTNGTRSVDVWKTYIRVMINGAEMPSMVERHGPLQVNGDGAAMALAGDNHYNPDPLAFGSDPTKDNFTVVSEDEENLGFKRGNVAIGILPTRDAAERKSGIVSQQDFHIIVGYIGDAGYNRDRKRNHGGSEWTYNTATELGYSGGNGGNYSDKVQGTTILIKNFTKPMSWSANKPKTSADAELFWVTYYSLARIAIDSDREKRKGCSSDCPSNITVEYGGKTRYSYEYDKEGGGKFDVYAPDEK